MAKFVGARGAAAGQQVRIEEGVGRRGEHVEEGVMLVQRRLLPRLERSMVCQGEMQCRDRVNIVNSLYFFSNSPLVLVD